MVCLALIPLETPESLWYNWEHNPDDVTRRVVETIREIKPHVVITFNRYGGYGHPDHIAIQQATTQAFDLAGDSNYMTDGFSPYAPQKLYYNSIPIMMIHLGIFIMRLRRKDPRKLGRNQDIDMLAIAENVEPAHTKIDIKDYLDAWDEANACHASQGGGRSGLIPRWLRKRLGFKQGLTRIHPKPVHNRIDEYDLFTGVLLEESSIQQQ